MASDGSVRSCFPVFYLLKRRTRRVQMSSWCGAATKQARQRSKNHAQCSLDLECVCGSENSKIQAQVHIAIHRNTKSFEESNINDTGGQTCNFVSSLSKRSVEWLWPRHGVWSCCDRQECHAVKWEPDPRATDADRISILADLQLLKTYDRTSDSKSCVAKLAMLATGSFYLVHLKVPVCQHLQFGRFRLNTNTRLVIKSDFNENSWNFETRLRGSLGSNGPTPFLASWILASIRAEQRVEVVMRCWTTQFAEPL